MNENEIYNALQHGGPFALPFLLKLYHPTAGALYYVNNTEDVEFNGNIYKAGSFKYTKPRTMGGVLTNGSLEITALEELRDLIENSDELFKVEAVGIIDKAGDITPIKIFRHQYGTVTTTERMTVVINFTNDDRLEMVFPPYVFDADNNRGNA